MLDREPYEHISPTAKLVVEMRRYSDVPFAEELASATSSRDSLLEATGGAPLSQGLLSWMAPMLEARYKSVARAIETSRTPQVVELASGFAFRGATMAGPTRRYVETDLPAVHAERLRMAGELGLPASTAYVLAPADATHADALSSWLRDGEPVAVVCEGLLQYLGRDEKAAVAGAIAHLLDRFGGQWCTPDFETLEDSPHVHWRDPQFAQVGAYIARATRRDLRDAAFATKADVRAFLSELGFRVETTPQLDGSFELASVARTGATAEQVAILRASRTMWTMRRAT